ncbi:2-dehydro-3-deoxy-phosphogluconate aldolase [Polycladomyces abyssicola]|uniref:2-dehydro-3-deoxy-phosphogluconate aldolase n=1 Tax=Polycladomyces abyssicola TaxID=1125966 RepID=A0A8D5ZNQ0_9BACL|nr:bifunctional 4-hydroxy-2-oxoglutarate aldolase/2-dehydro-3-deoxy-phosphogluconate aldolase [Polycladomyces abyssicola]BCU81573.1 2-dehydro-3-deoxy-phosphogluconate aldolase [Polycladomyces abyssicola]
MIQKMFLIQKLTESGVIAVIRRLPEASVEKVAESLVAGGITALEVTVDSPGAFTVIRKLAEKFKDHAIVGAGTVLDAESARLAIDSGAEFLLSPSLHRDVIQTALRYGKIAVPGVLTPTEMITAVEWGADLVKLFPASVMGAQYMKEIKAPFPHIPVIPTGGIHLDNLTSFIKAGAAAVGIGGNLLDRKVIEAGDFSTITAIARRYVTAVQQARG